MTASAVTEIRAAGDWAPFMAALRAEMIHRRRRRRLRGAALLILGSLFFFSAVWIERKSSDSPRLVVAAVPTAQDPLFATAAGQVEHLPGGEWVVRGGGSP